MGPLTFPSGSPVYVDTQIVIYSVEKHPSYFPLLQPFWQAVQTGSLLVITSELTIMETLVGPLKSNNTALARTYEQFLQLGGIQLIPVSAAILREAAGLRAAVTKLRTPDAIHAASAAHGNTRHFLTNDMAFRGVSGLNVTILKDFLSIP